jgi:hypothetical protein
MVFNSISGHSRDIDNSVKLRLSNNRAKTMNPSYYFPISHGEINKKEYSDERRQNS